MHSEATKLLRAEHTVTFKKNAFCITIATPACLRARGLSVVDHSRKMPAQPARRLEMAKSFSGRSPLYDI